MLLETTVCCSGGFDTALQFYLHEVEEEGMEVSRKAFVYLVQIRKSWFLGSTNASTMEQSGLSGIFEELVRIAYNQLYFVVLRAAQSQASNIQ